VGFPMSGGRVTHFGVLLGPRICCSTYIVWCEREVNTTPAVPVTVGEPACVGMQACDTLAWGGLKKGKS
jgi:hypothetical protein